MGEWGQLEHIYFIELYANNIGFLLVTMFAHTIGSVWVLKTHGSDSRDTITAIANMLQNDNRKDPQIEKDLKLIMDYIRHYKKTNLKL